MSEPKNTIRTIVEMRIEDLSRRKVEQLPGGWIKTITYHQVNRTPSYDWAPVEPKKKLAKKKGKK